MTGIKTEIEGVDSGNQQSDTTPDRTQQIIDWINAGRLERTPPLLFEPIYSQDPEP